MARARARADFRLRACAARDVDDDDERDRVDDRSIYRLIDPQLVDQPGIWVPGMLGDNRR